MIKLGTRLQRKKLVDGQEIELALAIQKQYGGLLGDILTSISSIRSVDFYKTLAENYNLPFVNLLDTNIDPELLDFKDESFYFDACVIPIKHTDGSLTVATSDPSVDNSKIIKNKWGNDTEIVCTSQFDILYILQRDFKGRYLDDAVNGLIDSSPSLSSHYVLNTWQRFFFFFLFIALIVGAALEPVYLMYAINIAVTFSVLFIIVYKLLLALLTLFTDRQEAYIQTINDDELPVYSILLPLYNEKRITLERLFKSIDALNYPKHKLDIKVLLEEDDLSTIDIVKGLKLKHNYRLIYIPQSTPRTKAKACNYGLNFIRGEYVTLYDAEDSPEPDQLRIALEAFKHGPKNAACYQAHLNFYNKEDNWLTKMFTIEYSYWFDLLLPGLEYTGALIPLGGTSNHFKVKYLEMVNQWDAYNVTEDADLGIRLRRLGFKCGTIDSTTFEEANCQFINWIKQRTRWVKGYIQTYLVHMREPLKLFKTVGFRGFVSLQLFVGGTILTNFFNLILWFIFGMSLLLPNESVNFLFNPSVLWIAKLNLYLGSILIILLNILAVFKRRYYSLLPYALTAPLYWFMMSIATYRSIYQIIFKPSVWEKTEHGISKSLRNKD